MTPSPKYRFHHPYTASEKEYLEQWQASVSHPLTFWGDQATLIPWIRPYTNVWQPPQGEEDAFVGKWFVGGKINAAAVCVDRWAASHPDEIALTWIGEEDTEEHPQRRIFSYASFAKLINQAANLLKKCNVVRGDRVGLWLPMVPEALITLFACAKIGAIPVVVFSGFSSNNTEERLSNAGCKVLVTANEGKRRGKSISLRHTLSEAYVNNEDLHAIICVDNSQTTHLLSRKDLFWQQEIPAMSTECQTEAMDAEDPLFLLYTSGTTGKPKGIVHSTGGYLVYASSTMRAVWGIRGLIQPDPRTKREVWFCTADIGWITGHSYVAYAPFALGTHVVIYEGAFNYPTPGRLFDIIDRYQVSHLYTSPTLIRQLAADKENYVSSYRLDTLRVLGSVGEPINSEAWHWYHEQLGQSACPIVDTYWQTETGGFLFSPCAGVTTIKPGSCCVPCLGIKPAILSESGHAVQKGDKGFLCITHPWPGMMRSIFKDHSRFLTTYLTRITGTYTTGDEAYQDEDGHVWIAGRADDVIKVSGHRFGSAELEENISHFPHVVESAVVPLPDPITGNSIAAFVVSKIPLDTEKLRSHIRNTYGAIAVPKDIIQVPDLPKTCSGKVMRRMLKNLFLGLEVGDTSTLVNPDSISMLSSQLRAAPITEAPSCIIENT